MKVLNCKLVITNQTDVLLQSVQQATNQIHAVARDAPVSCYKIQLRHDTQITLHSTYTELYFDEIEIVISAFCKIDYKKIYFTIN